MRFRVIDHYDTALIAAGITDPDFLPDISEDYWEGWTSLWDFKDPLKPLFVARDGGEPEDQLFYRNWSWVPNLLNKLDEEIVLLEKKSQ